MLFVIYENIHDSLLISIKLWTVCLGVYRFNTSLYWNDRVLIMTSTYHDDVLPNTSRSMMLVTKFLAVWWAYNKAQFWYRPPKYCWPSSTNDWMLVTTIDLNALGCRLLITSIFWYSCHFLRVKLLTDDNILVGSSINAPNHRLGFHKDTITAGIIVAVRWIQQQNLYSLVNPRCNNMNDTQFKLSSYS